jgi:hypothetical protein
MITAVTLNGVAATVSAAATDAFRDSLRGCAGAADVQRACGT